MNHPWLKRALPWALYDWANSAFATVVIAGFVPLVNKDYWSLGASETVSTFRLSLANSSAGIIVALLAPVLGAIADRGGSRKRFLLCFATLGVAMTAALPLAEQGQWAMALGFYVIASIGFSGGNVFYDSLLVQVADESKLDMVSALGFGLGYVGGGLLFGLNLWMVSRPEVFGFTGAHQATQWAFISVAIWWTLFTLPLALFVPETRIKTEPVGYWPAVRSGLRQLRQTFAEIRRQRTVFTFLLGYWLYIDGVNTVVRMAIDYGRALGLPANSLILALLITQFVGFPAALIFGKIGERFGARTGILIGLGAYIGICGFGYFMTSFTHFLLLAIAVGLVQGGVQSLSRSLFARLIPGDKAGEFFGFYNMLGKFAVIIGPLLMSGVGLATGNPRLGILSLLLLFVLGAALLWRVRVPGETA